MTVPGADSTRLGPHRLDRVDDHERRRPALREGLDDVLDVGVGGELDRVRAQAQPLGTQAHLPDRLLARDIATRSPWPAMAAEACISRVDLPMPGSPPSRITEPRTKPPPVTRSSSAMPEGRRGASLASPVSPSRGKTRPRPATGADRGRAGLGRRGRALPRRSCSSRCRLRNGRAAVVARHGLADEGLVDLGHNDDAVQESGLLHFLSLRWPARSLLRGLRLCSGTLGGGVAAVVAMDQAATIGCEHNGNLNSVRIS